MQSNLIVFPQDSQCIDLTYIVQFKSRLSLLHASFPWIKKKCQRKLEFPHLRFIILPQQCHNLLSVHPNAKNRWGIQTIELKVPHPLEPCTLFSPSGHYPQLQLQFCSPYRYYYIQQPFFFFNSISTHIITSQPTMPYQ